MTSTNTTIIGAGLAGSLLALLLARRGERVTIYERLPDSRSHTLDAGRSINLALAARGIRALEQAGVMEQVRPLLIPMPGRMLHTLDGKQTLSPYGQTAQEVIYSVSRPALNQVLMTAAEAAGVDIRFQQPLVSAHFPRKKLLLRDEFEQREYEVPMQNVIGADGAGSVLRRTLAAYASIRSGEDLLPHGYKELTLPADAQGRHQLDPNALHLWPRGGFMLIALPNTDGSFTVTLFLARSGEADSFDALHTPAQIDAFFARHFADVHALMPGLAQEFLEHPMGLMGTVRCSRWSLGDQLLLIGDAAHAVTPFHGQGMNCAFEDCRLLADLLAVEPDRARAFEQFETQRRADTDAIAVMALENYLEMRDTVRDPRFPLYKALSFELERRIPTHFVPRYSMVMFHDEIPYSVAFARGEIQQQLLTEFAGQATSLQDVDLQHAVERVREVLSPLNAVPT